MTANLHPYPKRVFNAALSEIRPFASNEEAAHAATFGALLALRQADTPSTLSADEARTIWSHALQIYNGDHEGLHGLRTLLAQHAPDWGNHDR